MKKFLILFLASFALIAAGVVTTNTVIKVSDLPAADSVGTNDIVYLVQPSGSTYVSRRMTVSNFLYHLSLDQESLLDTVISNVLVLGGNATNAIGSTNGFGFGVTTIATNKSYQVIATNIMAGTNVVRGMVVIGTTNINWGGAYASSAGNIGGPPTPGMGVLAFVRDNGSDWSGISWYRKDEPSDYYINIGADVYATGDWFNLIYDNSIGFDMLRYGLHDGQRSKFGFGPQGIDQNSFIRMDDPILWTTTGTNNAYRTTNTIYMTSRENGIHWQSFSNNAAALDIIRGTVDQKHSLDWSHGTYRWRSFIQTNAVDIYHWVLTQEQLQSDVPGGTNAGGAWERLRIQHGNVTNTPLGTITYNAELFSGLQLGMARRADGAYQASGDGQEARLSGFEGGTNKWQIFGGDGSPVNVYQAPVGSIYMRSDGASGTSAYFKVGSAITAWVPSPVAGELSTNDVWLLPRADGVDGDGSLLNPRDASTTAKFDAIMDDQIPNRVLHLLPGTYTTMGSVFATRGLVRGNQVLGSGITNTVIRLDPAWATTNAGYSSGKHAFVLATLNEGDDVFPAQADIRIADLTLDCNYGNIVVAAKTNYAFGHIELQSANAIVERVRCINGHDASGTSVEAFSLYLPGSNNVVRNCIIEKWQRNPAASAVTGATMCRLGHGGIFKENVINLADAVAGTMSINGISLKNKKVTVKDNWFIGCTNLNFFAIYSDTDDSGKEPTEWNIDGNYFIDIKEGIAPRLAAVKFANSRIQNNYFKILGGAATGGAIYSDASSGSPTWTNVWFNNNYIEADGTGQNAVYMINSITITNLYMNDNVMKPGMLVTIPANAVIVGYNNLTTIGLPWTNSITGSGITPAPSFSGSGSSSNVVAAGTNIVVGTNSGVFTVSLSDPLSISQANIGTIVLTNPVPLASGGLGVALTDPNADRIPFWDDSAGNFAWLTAGTGLLISGTTMTATATGETNWSVVGGKVTTTNDVDVIGTARISSAAQPSAGIIAIGTNNWTITADNQAGGNEITIAHAVGGAVMQLETNGAVTIAKNLIVGQPSDGSIFTNQTFTIAGFTADGGGSALSTGKTKGFVVAQRNFTITGWSIVADAGTATVKVWKIASGTAKPTIANVINTSGVALASGTAIISSTVSDFTTTTVTAGDIFAFDITAVATATELTFQLKGVTR